MIIPMPNDNEKEKSINTILIQGIKKPKSIISYLNLLYRNIGLRHIFWDIWDAILYMVIMSAGIMILSYFSFKSFDSVLLFTFSPSVYLFLTVITELKERMDCLYDLKMTCTFTIQQITAFRMICFSILGIVFSSFLSVFSWFIQDGTVNFFNQLSISMLALFLCSTLSLEVIVYIPYKKSIIAVPVIWSLICIIPVIIFGNNWTLYLNNIPPAIAILVICLCIILSLKEIKKLISINGRGVIYYVNG